MDMAGRASVNKAGGSVQPSRKKRETIPVRVRSQSVSLEV